MLTPSPEASPNRSSRTLTRRGFLTALGATGVVIATEAAFPHIPYDTDPYNIRDSTIWRLLRGPFGGVMGLCGGKDKSSNYWQWSTVEMPPFEPSAILEGNFDTFVRENTLDNIKMSCGGIHEVYQLTPLTTEPWRIIFQTVYRSPSGDFEPYELTGNLFSGILRGKIKFMRGNGDVRIYAMDAKGRRVSLEVAGPFSREEKSLEGLLI